MGLAKGIFMIDTQSYAQRPTRENIDDSETILYHMERYGVDMCLIKSSVGYSNEFNAEMVKKYPNKFVAFCNDSQTQAKSQTGEVKWNIKDAAKEIDDLLSTGYYRGIGEGMARDRTPKKALISWDERLDQICHIMEVARKHKCPVSYHTGIPIGATWLDMARSRAHAEMCDNGNPLLCHEVAALYPDVPIIMSHGGIESSGYYMDDYEKCLNVAASHHNVFLETGQWWAELYTKPLMDPNIGAKKLVWGCGWGQGNLMQQWMPGEVPTTYNSVNIYAEQTQLQPDVWGWSLREIGRLNIPQDDLNLILGGNAAYLLKIDTPVPYERLFKKVDRQI